MSRWIVAMLLSAFLVGHAVAALAYQGVYPPGWHGHSGQPAGHKKHIHLPPPKKA